MSSRLHASVALTLVNILPVYTVEDDGSEYNLVTIPTGLSWFLSHKSNSKYLISKTLIVGNSMHVSWEAS